VYLGHLEENERQIMTGFSHWAYPQIIFC